MEALSALSWHVLPFIAFSFGGRLIPPENQRECQELLNRDYPEALLDEALGIYLDIAHKSCDLASIAELARGFYPGSSGKSDARSLFIPRMVNYEWPATTRNFVGFTGDTSITYEPDHRAGANPWNNLGIKPIGTRIEGEGRLIIVGVPGTGKTSLITWLANAYLLRLKNDPDLDKYPGIDTLPDRDLVPIVARCRDINRFDYDDWYKKILGLINERFGITDELLGALAVALKRKMEQGNAILLVDGIDEASNENVEFHIWLTIYTIVENSRRLPVVVTSSEAQPSSWHSMRLFYGKYSIPPFSSEQKDEFARKWCSIAWPEKRRDEKSTALINAIHSSPEIETLTGLPIHLSMLAQVMDRGTAVPKNRAQLYNLAVRALIDSPNEDSGIIDRRDAMPQLEYIAGEMWRKDLTRAPESAILKWLDRFHVKHPEFKPVRDHTSDEFLRLIKRRTKILVESSDFKHENPDDPEYEFRHIIYRDFLVGRALVEKRFEDCTGDETVGELVGRLTSGISLHERATADMIHCVLDRWIIPLKICISLVDKTEAEKIMSVILDSARENPPEYTSHGQQILAGYCLAERPDVSPEVASRVLSAFLKFSSEYEFNICGLESNTAIVLEDLAETPLREELLKLMKEAMPHYKGSVRGMVQNIFERITAPVSHEDVDPETRLVQLYAELDSGDDDTTVRVLNEIREIARTKGPVRIPEGLPWKILGLIKRNETVSSAASHAIGWLTNFREDKPPSWTPSRDDITRIIELIHQPDLFPNALDTYVWLMHMTKDDREFDVLVGLLNSDDELTLMTVASRLASMDDSRVVDVLLENYEKFSLGMQALTITKAFERFREPRAIKPLRNSMDNSGSLYWGRFMKALVAITRDVIDTSLASGFYMMGGIIKPSWGIHYYQIVDNEMVKTASLALKIPEEEVRTRYESLSAEFGIQLSWKPESIRDDNPWSGPGSCRPR